MNKKIKISLLMVSFIFFIYQNEVKANFLQILPGPLAAIIIFCFCCRGRNIQNQQPANNPNNNQEIENINTPNANTRIDGNVI